MASPENDYDEPPPQDSDGDGDDDGQGESMMMEQAIRDSQETVAQAFAGDLETRYVALKQSRDALEETKTNQEEQIAHLEAKTKELQNDLLEREEQLAMAKQAANSLQRETENRKSDETNQQERMSRMEAEADNLREEISRLVGSNKELSAKIVEVETKAKLTESSAVPLSYEVERTRKELDSLSTHTQWLETELQERTQQLIQEKHAHSQQVLELSQQLDVTVVERDEAKSTMLALTKSQHDLRTKTEQLALKLREAEQEAANMKESSTRELQAERNLVALQQQQLDNRALEYNRLVQEKEALTELANQASDATKREVDAIRLTLEEESHKVVSEQNELHARQVALLRKKVEEANRRCREAEDGFMSSPARPRLGGDAPTNRLVALTQGGSGEPLGLTELYERLATTEDELLKEKTAHRQLRLMMEKTMADIESKTQQVVRDRQEGEFAKQQLEESNSRLDAALGELKALHQELKETTLDKEELNKQNRELKQDTAELARQVQALLVSRAGGEPDSEIPISVQEIQMQNQQLLQEHRRLTQTVEELEEKLQDDLVQNQLAQAQEELKTLHEDRVKQEAAVTAIVTQRDLYRALVTGQNNSLGGDDIDSVSELADRNKQLVQRNAELESTFGKARADVDGMTRDKETLEHRVARYDVLTTELTASVNELQTKLSSAVATVARAESDAGYHREKCTRLEELVDQCRAEAQRAQEAANQMQAVNGNLQRTVAAANAEASKRELETRQAGMKLRLAETQVETAKASELRLANEVSQLQTEIARQGALLESVQRIEASLSAKNDETKERLTEDYQRLQEVLSAERSKHSVDMENLSGRTRELELDLKAAEEKRDEAMAALLEAKKQDLAKSEELQQLASKCSTLEAELRSAKRKLGVEDIEGEDAELALQTKVISLTTDLEAAQAELASAKERVTAFQNLATLNEDALAELTKATDEYKTTTVKEMEALKAKLEDLQKDTNAKQQMIVELTDDLANQRGECEKIVGELNGKIDSLEAEAISLRKDAEVAESRVAAMNAEVSSYQADATTAQNNYEREVIKHGVTTANLHRVQQDAEKDKLQRREAEERLEMVNLQIEDERKLLSEQKTNYDETVKNLEKSLEDARAQNGVLHRQLAAQGDELEKLQSSRIETTATSDAAEGETDSGAEPLRSDIESLRQQRSELRELVRFVRSENDMSKAQADAARRTAEREKAAAAVTKRSLEEARAELKTLQSSRVDAAESENSQVKDLTDKLSGANDQLRLLRESNTLLREETEKLRASSSSIQAELSTIKTSVAPNEKKLKELEGDKSALEAEKASLTRELDDWKRRVNSLVSKFNQIDPDEHEKALRQVNELTKECDAMKAAKETAEKATDNAKTLVQQLNKQLSQQRELVNKQKTAMAKLASDKDAAAASSSKVSSETSKERDQLREQVKKLTADEKSTKTELDGANTRIEKLKNHLRTYQKKMSELQKKLQQSEANLSASKAELKAAQAAPAAESQSTGSLPKAAEKANSGASAVATPDATSAATKEAAKVQPEEEAAPAVPPGGFRYGPGGSLQPPSSQAARKRRATASPPRQEPEVTKQDDPSRAVSKKPKPSPSIAAAKIHPASKPNETAGAAGQPEANVDTTQAKSGGEKTEEDDLRAKLLKRKRRLEATLKKADGEKDAKRAAIAREEPKTTERKTDADGEKDTKEAETAKEEPTDVEQKTDADVEMTEKPKEIDAAGEEDTSAEPVVATATAPAPAPAEYSEEEKPAGEPQETSAVTEPTIPEGEDKEPVGGAAQEQVVAVVTGPNEAPASSEATAEAAMPTEAKDDAPVAPGESSKEEAVPMKTEKPKTSLFGKPSTFGTGAPFGSGTSFGTGPFGKSTAAPLSFGTSSTVATKEADGKGGSGDGSSITAAPSTSNDKPQPAFGSGGPFLNMKPPGSTETPKFTFGSSSTITLPTPAKGLPSTTSPFGAFGQGTTGGANNPFGSGSMSHSSSSSTAAQVVAQPLFGGGSAAAATSTTTSAPAEPTAVDDNNDDDGEIEENEGEVVDEQEEDGTDDGAEEEIAESDEEDGNDGEDKQETDE